MLAAGVLVMTLAIVAFLSAGLALAAMLRRIHRRDRRCVVVRRPDDHAPRRRSRLELAVIGGAVAAVGRHTAAALGVVFVWTAVVEGLIRGLRPHFTPWLLGDNLVTFLSWQRMQVQFAPFDSYTITPERALFVIAGYTALTLALGFAFVRLRDVQ